MPAVAVGTSIRAVDFPASKYASDSTSLANLSSTTFAAGSPVCSTTFTAPTSGMILLTVGAGFRDNTATNRVHVAPAVYLGTSSGGTLFLAADVATRGVGSPAAIGDYTYRSRTTLLTGLTPGATYYVETQHKVSGGTTADLAQRDLSVVPCPMGGNYSGQDIAALDYPVAVWAQDSTQINNPADRSYVTGTPEVSVTFYAPTSGNVLVVVGGGLGNGSSAPDNRVFMSPRIRLTNSSGANVLSPSVLNRGVGSDATSVGFAYFSRESIVSGLTPGQLYYAVIQYVVPNDGNGDTQDIAVREIVVAPIP